MKYKNHPSILAIQKNSKNKTFHFEEVKSGKVEKEILKLDKTKASQKTNIPTRIIKENIDIFADLNSAIKSSNFFSSLKLTDVTPVHKKGRKYIKENFRPVSILTALSKIFEMCMFAQMPSFFDNIFSNQLCLLVMLETWKRYVDTGEVLVLY